MKFLAGPSTDPAFSKGRMTTSAEGASFLAGSLGTCFPRNFLKIGVSKMAISSNLRQISYSCNTNFLFVNFVLVKKEKKVKKGWGGGTHPHPSSPPSLFGSATGFGEMLLWEILKI